MGTATNSTLPFLGMNIAKIGYKLETSLYRKPTTSRVDSHVKQRCKTALLTVGSPGSGQHSKYWYLYQNLIAS